MKYLKYFLILLLMPFIVFAEECDISKITIISIEQSEINGNTEVISEPIIKDGNIKLNLKMYEVDDSITYDLTIKNDSDEDYVIDEDTFKTDSDYIEYSLKTNDNTNVVKSRSSKNVTLTVTYKKEVEDNLLSNNKFDASNSLKLSLNTNEKEKELDVITTDNIKEVKNPITSVSSMLLIIVLLLITTIIIYVLITRKNKYTKYIMFILLVLIVPTVYAICKVDIEVESKIEIEKKEKLFDKIAELSNDNFCITKYENEVTDEVGVTATANNVYVDKCADKRNVVFNNFCWQVIRTTNTGGVKLIYNGEPDQNGECGKSRVNHKGIVNYANADQFLDSNYLYGSSFTYNTSTNEFTLIDTITATWDNTTYESLLGKYTCKNTTGTCTTIYNINEYKSYNIAYTTSYTIGDTNYAQIGTTSYNSGNNSLTNVGYMFNERYAAGASSPVGSLFGNDVSYENGIYTLLPASGESVLSDSLDTNHHYTCNNTIGTCNNVRYYFYNNSFVLLKDGVNVEEAVNKMLLNDNVNKYNSTIKGLIDSWYIQNMSDETNRLEDTVFCNSREITNNSSNGWFKTGDLSEKLNFKNYSISTDLSCMNIIDQFSTKNNKAKLTYPVGLMQAEEVNIINDASLMATGVAYWNMSAHYMSSYSANSFVNNSGIVSGSMTSSTNGVRPVVSLANKVLVASGNGSETDPWIVE